MNKIDPYEQIAMMTIHMWDLCLNGREIGLDIYRYMKAEPQVGDLVLEMSTAYKRIHDHKQGREKHFNSGGLGFFLRKQREQCVWEDLEDGEEPPTCGSARNTRIRWLKS